MNNFKLSLERMNNDLDECNIASDSEKETIESLLLELG